MNRVLIVKLSSMGDLVQALPAVSDAARALPHTRFDWVVDEAFAEVPAWHPAIDRVIVSAHRRWRKQFWVSLTSGQLRDFYRTLRERDYSAVVDAQTSLKSALVTRLARGERRGPDKHSVREYGAHWAYQQQVAVAQDILAVDRWRQLFSAALGYPLPSSTPDFGLKGKTWPESEHRPIAPYLVAVTNASWATKRLPAATWRRLIVLANDSGLNVLLPWGSEPERLQANAIAEGMSNAVVLPRLSLTEIASLLASSQGALCNDTGLAHIAAALGVPTVTAYGPTDPALIAATGERSAQLSATGFSCAPCYKHHCHIGDYQGSEAQCLASLEAKYLWERLCGLMA